MKQIARNLEREMGKAVSIIVTACHAAAKEALDEAFGAADQDHTVERKRGAGGQKRRTRRRPSSPRRSGEQIATLEKQLLDAVWATPGEAMSALAPRIGVPPRALQVPAARLKSTGRLKTVGMRQFTRYFPAERGVEGGAEPDA